MSIVFVFILYLAAVTLVAVPSTIVFMLIGRYLSRKAPRPLQRRFMIYGALLPILAGAYAILLIIAMAIFGAATGRDIGFGDGFDLPLDNEYHWSAIDITEVATITARGSDVFDNVLALQQHGDWLALATLPGLDHTKFDIDPSAYKPDHWFLFNTAHQQRIEAPTESALATAAQQHGFALHLEPSADFYAHHRYRWYDFVVAFSLCLPALAFIIWIYREARQLLRESQNPTGHLPSNAYASEP
jgi:hypothetical protein